MPHCWKSHIVLGGVQHYIKYLMIYANSPIRSYPLSYSEVLIDFSLTLKAATLIFISGLGSAISSAKKGKSGSIYNLVKNK